MNCAEYREKHKVFGILPLPKKVWDTPEWDEWMNHSHHCMACSDWTLYQEIKKRGYNPEDYPCVHIANQVTLHCDKCSDPAECSNILITHHNKFDEYGIPKGHGTYAIQFCPWCGVRLPEQKRDRWFDELRALGFDDPVDQEIPEEYLTDAWYRKNT